MSFESDVYNWDFWRKIEKYAIVNVGFLNAKFGFILIVNLKAFDDK